MNIHAYKGANGPLSLIPCGNGSSTFNMYIPTIQLKLDNCA